MFKIYTKHTQEVDETIFEHLRFTLKIAYIMSISSFLFIIHGFTGGLFEMPEKFPLVYSIIQHQLPLTFV